MSVRTAPKKTGICLSLRCSCGSTLSNRVPIRATDAIKIRDIFLSFHRDAACAITDTSKDVE